MNPKVKNNLLNQLRGKTAIAYDLVDDDDSGESVLTTLVYITHPAFGNHYYQLDMYAGIVGGPISDLGEHELKKLVKGLLASGESLIEVIENWNNAPFEANSWNTAGATSGANLISMLRRNNNFPELFLVDQEDRLRIAAEEETPKTPSKPKV